MNKDLSAAPVVTIKPSKGWVSLRVRELWEYRELLYFLTWREVKVRYKQTVLGAAWAVIQPFVTMVVFSLVFGRLAKIPSDDLPYPIWSYTALLPWNYFSQSLTNASNSLVGSANLIKKVYFPRLVIPISGVISGIIDFSIAFVILILMMLYYGIHVGLNAVLLPCFLMLALITALGVSLWISALNVEYRDFRHIVPFMTQFWMFATPVVYPSSLLPERWRIVYGLNPMAGVIEGFRWALLGADPPGKMLVVSAAVACAVCLTGVFYFRRMEKNFADVV